MNVHLWILQTVVVMAFCLGSLVVLDVPRGLVRLTIKPAGAGTALYYLTLRVSLSLSSKFAQLYYLSKLKTGLAKVPYVF